MMIDSIVWRSLVRVVACILFSSRSGSFCSSKLVVETPRRFYLEKKEEGEKRTELWKR